LFRKSIAHWSDSLIDICGGMWPALKGSSQKPPQSLP
jgi:hypothetical protein